MKTLTANVKRRIRIYAIFLLAGIVAFSCSPFFSKPVKADYVTDYIGVKVGYAGRELKDYVLVGDYHISEIESNLPVYEYAYSFFNQNTLNPAKYNYVVDSARGILVKDLLDYAKIYYGDIYNLNFWVQDHNGMWCSFDRDSLFAGNRYYFNNLPGHRKIKYKTFKKVDAGSGSMSLLGEEVESDNLSLMEGDAENDGLTLMEDDADSDGLYLMEEEPESQKPESQEPESQKPESQEPESQEPESQEPESQEPEPQEPESQEPESQEPESQEPESQEPESQEPESQEPESQKPEEEETITDYSVILGYDFSECWSDCSTVPPMLAIEDNWTSFNEEFESAGPNFTTLTTGSRFRLLYGQFSPTDENTRDSAKYVRYVYVTLAGAPQFVKPEKTKPLKTKVGSTDTVEFAVEDIYNEDMTDRLTEYMSIYSTNEAVIKITKVNVKKSAEYSDRAKVEVTYKVVGEGKATIGGTFGSYNGDPNSGGEGMIQLQTVTTENAKDGNTLLPDPEKETKNQKPGKTDPSKEKAPEKESEKEPALPGNTAPEDGENNHQINGKDNATNIEKSPENGTASDPAINGLSELESAEHKVAQAQAEELKTSHGPTYVYQLSDELVKKLQGLEEEDLPEPAVPVTEEVQQLELEDHSEEEQQHRKMILIWTGIGCLGVCVIGGLAEFIGFRFRLKKRLRKQA